jgi:hypothetical protein
MPRLTPEQIGETPPETPTLLPRLTPPSDDASRPVAPTEADDTALRVARDLILAGVPVFRAKPDLFNGVWNPLGGTGATGYWLPMRWENTVADLAVLDQWRPGDALCALMGHTFDALDVDPRHDGHKTAAEWKAAGDWPDVYGQQQTPSGGTHDLVARLGISKTKSGGIDVQAGATDGRGRAFIFIAPTVRVSKESGELGTYVWTDVPDPHRMQQAAADHSGARLVARLASGESAKGTSKPRSNQRQNLAQKLADPPSRGEGKTNDWLISVAGSFARKHRSNKFDVYIADLLQAIPQHVRDYEEFDKTAKSAWDTQQSKPEDEVKESPTVVVIAFVREHYDFFATPEGEVFAIARAGHRRPIIMGENGSGAIKSRVTADLFERDGRVPSSTSVEDALRVIYSQTVVDPNTHELDLRVAERPGTIVVDLAEPGTSRCVVVTADGWSVEAQPPPGVLFRLSRTTKPIPEPSRGGSLGDLRELLDWAERDPRWVLVSGWLVAACVPSIPRPLLAFVGQPGSAKTTRARLVLSVLDPRNELGSSFGKNEGDEQVMAAGRYLVGWDNISRASDDVSDRLCRVVTGEESVKRKLYTGQDQEVISYRRTGAITAVTLPNLRADALERLIPIGCDRIDGRARRSEGKIREAFETSHGSILGGLMDALVAVLQRLPDSRAREANRVRMADFQDVLHALDPEVAEVYAGSVKNVMVEAAESDPFVSAVTDWLATKELPLTLLAAQAWHEASLFRQRVSPDDPAPWWPRSAPSFSALLSKNAEPLHALGLQVDPSRKTKQGRQLVFFRPGQSEQGAFEEGDR